MSGTPRTWFSGKTPPLRTVKVWNGSTWAAIAFFLFSPLGALTAVVGYLAFTLGRFSWKVIGGVTAIYAAVFLLGGGFNPGFLGRYLAPWMEAWSAAWSKTSGGLPAVAADRWPHWVLARVGLSLLLGGVFATAMTGWKWMRRAPWDLEANRRRPGPYEVWRLRRNVAAIANGTIAPKDGHTVGTTDTGKRSRRAWPKAQPTPSSPEGPVRQGSGCRHPDPHAVRLGSDG